MHQKSNSVNPRERKKLTSAQCRAARGLINISQQELAMAAGIAKRTLAAFEAGKSEPHVLTLVAIREALEERGVIFLDENGNGPGVCERRG